MNPEKQKLVEALEAGIAERKASVEAQTPTKVSTITCEFCKRGVPTPEAFAWLLVTYRPTRSEYLNREMRRSYNFCSIRHLLAFYSPVHAAEEAQRG